MFRFLRFLSYWFAPTKDALFCPNLSWQYRWRLLALQPLALLTYSIKYLPYLFSRRYSVINIPTRGQHTVRAIVFQPPNRADSKLCPLHIDFHGGAFLGGVAEYDAPFCEVLSDRVGAVVISAQYRSAPAHMYPCAHEDAEDVIEWVLQNAKRWNADPHSLTVSGSSAGANLMFTAGTRAKAAVGICSLVDLRIPPWQKPKPENFPKVDPLFWMNPLFDAYAGGSESLQALRNTDTSLSPILKSPSELPQHLLFIVAGIDILAHEQLAFVHRLNADVQVEQGKCSRVFKCIVFEKGFHGWLELPSAVVGEQGRDDRKRAFDEAIGFLIHAHKDNMPVSSPL